MRYSISMVSILSFMEQWSPDRFSAYMKTTKTNSIELIPSLVLGPSWQRFAELNSKEYKDMLIFLNAEFNVSAIQSLLFGLDIQLGKTQLSSLPLQSRFQALSMLGRQLGCFRFILGAPSSRRLGSQQSHAKAQSTFIDNCSLMASQLDLDQILCLEHNTLDQGAEFMNTLESVHYAVQELRRDGINNIGINLDTKCIANQFGDECHLHTILDDELIDNVYSIQISYDFVERGDSPAGLENIKTLSRIACEKSIVLALEEYGLRLAESAHFVSRFCDLFG